MARAMHGALVLLVVVALMYMPAAAAIGYHGPVGARPVIFNFGDSNSDTGGYAAGGINRISLPAGRTFFHHPAGRFSDGRLIIDFLSESLNTRFLNPYLKGLSSDFSNGANFAIAGSTALPGLNLQVQRFLDFKKGSFINQGAQGFQNALYTIDIGLNDLNALLSTMTYDQVLANLAPIIAEIHRAVQTLYDNGGRNFWIHGTGAVGCLPENLADARKDGSDLDENGCLRTYNDAAKAFNAALSNMCDQMSLHLKDATIVYTDIFAIKYDLVTNHASYGFEKPLVACCGYGGPPYNFDASRRCMSGAQVCEIGSKFISWDGTHLTDAANAIVAAKILSGDFSKPKLKFDQFRGVV